MFLKSKKLVVAAMLSTMASSAFAAGTTSGTNVESTASLSFAVNGQTSTATSTNTFTVDNKVDLTVSTVDTQAVSVSPSATSVLLTYRVQNTGNTVQDYSLSALTTSTTAFSGAVTDTSDLNNVQVFVDVNNNNKYDVATDTLTYIDELEPDAKKTVFIVADVPADAVNDAIAVYDLQAQTAEGGTADTLGNDITSDNSNQVDDAATVQIVFADGAGTIDSQYDGKFSSTDAWKIVTATVTVSKDSIVISDPVNGTNNPKRIPGAEVRYCYIVANATGGANASGAVVSDTLDASVLSFNGAQIAMYDVNAAGTCDCTTATDIATGNGANGQDPSSQGVLKVDFDTVSGGQTKCGYVTATIK